MIIIESAYDSGAQPESLPILMLSFALSRFTFRHDGFVNLCLIADSHVQP